MNLKDISKQSSFLMQFMLMGIPLGAQQSDILLKQDYFEQIRTQKVQSSNLVEWKNFGPGMSGYCEEFWCHPTDSMVMFMSPDMHVSYGTWDGGKSWQTIKDPEGLGQQMKRVLDIEFSLQNPDFGMAIDWNGWAYKTTDRGRTWQKQGELGRSYQDLGVDPDGHNAFKEGWYYEQRGTRLSELAVDPTDDNTWYVGAGDFWNVKSNHKSAAHPHGLRFKYADYGYILKTVDRGKTWKKITEGLPEDLDVAKIIVNPNNPEHIIMATSHGVMLSRNAGMSWEPGGDGLPNNLPRDLTSFHDPNTGEFILYLVEQTVFQQQGGTVSAKGGVYSSTDGGRTWTNLTGNLHLDLAAIDYPVEVSRYYRALAYWFGTSESAARERFPELPSRTLPVFNRIAVNPRTQAMYRRYGITYIRITDVGISESGIR